MALTRSFLRSMNLTDEQISAIVEANSESLEGIKAERDKYKADAEKLTKVQGELDQLKESTKNSGDYDKLKKEFDDYKAEVKEKEETTAKRDALSKVAKDAGLSEAGIAKVVKYTNLADIELDEKGEIKEAKNLIKSLRDEWSEHIVTTTTKGAETSTPPRSTGTSVKSRDEIYKQDEHGRFVLNAEQRQKALTELIEKGN